MVVCPSVNRHTPWLKSAFAIRHLQLRSPHQRLTRPKTSLAFSVNLTAFKGFSVKFVVVATQNMDAGQAWTRCRPRSSGLEDSRWGLWSMAESTHCRTAVAAERMRDRSAPESVAADGCCREQA